jgi:hypothetical protein
MKRAILLFLILTTALAVAGTLEQITYRYGLWDSAYKRQDVKAMEAMLHSRFKLITGSGKVITRAEYVKGFGKGPKPAAYKTTVLKVTREGNSAVALTSESLKNPGEDEHVHKYRDKWVLLNGRWLLMESRTLEEH